MYFLNLDFWHAVMMKIVKCLALHGINAPVYPCIQEMHLIVNV